jgi:hypothetical protein
MTEEDLVVRLVRNAIATQKRAPDDFTEANADPDVKAAGNAAVGHALGVLGKHQVVVDVQPTMGRGGMGFAYKIHSQLVQAFISEEAIARRLKTLLGGPTSETSETIQDMLQKCEQAGLNAIYRDDLLASLKELQTCFAHDCFIACLALSGKLLEICLKQVMLDAGIPFDDTWMVGTLLRKLREANSEKYLDPSLGNIANIINQSRIPAVHAKEKIPVPSREQAIMVIHGVMDTINRAVLNP